MSEEFRNRQCRGKVLYDTLDQARRAAKEKHKKLKAPFTAYKCLCCAYFHIGRQRTKAAAKRRFERKKRDAQS